MIITNLTFRFYISKYNSVLFQMHLSFLLDLSTDDCDCSFVYDTACPTSPPSHKHKSSDVARMFFPTPRKSSTSGVQAFKGVMEGLPLTMEGVCQIFQLIHFLSRSQEHLRVEGLFRKHGKRKKTFLILIKRIL